MKKITINICLLLLLFNAYGRQVAEDDNPIAIPTIVPPAPTVANLMHFEEVPVDLYTGQANISIPLGSVPMLGGMQYPIAIQYNTQGIRVDERSGWLGTGFSMSTGGVISRTIRDLPDEINSHTAGIGIFHNDYSNFENFTGPQKEEFLWKTANGLEKYDASHDLFQYSFMGRSGRFIIKRVGNNLIPEIIGDITQDKITVLHNTNFEITGFRIVNTEGYIFNFDVHNTNIINSITISTPHFGSATTATSDLTGSQNVANAWNLASIDSPNNIELCRFTYQDVQENYNTPVSTTRNVMLGHHYFGATDVREANQGMVMPRVVTFSQSIQSTQKYVDEVIFYDSTIVKYILSGDGHPEFGPQSSTKLQEIEIRTPNGQLHKNIKFDYQVSANNRLFLVGIEEVFGSETLKYKLDYNKMDELPAFGSNLKDSWGYYSANGIVDLNHISTGTLQSIQYPTGGKKEFTFESNSFSYQGAALVDKHTIPANRLDQFLGPVELMNNQTTTSSQKILVYLDRPQQIDLDYQITQQGAGVILDNYGLMLSKATPKPGVSLTPMPVDGGPINYLNYNINDFEYHPSNMSFNFLNGDHSVGGGWYFLELKTTQSYLSLQDITLKIKVNLSYTTFQLNSLVKYGGGVRIKEIVFSDRGEQKKKLEYNYNDNHLVQSGGLGTVYDHVSSGSHELDWNSRTYIKGKDHPFLSGITPGLINVYHRYSYNIQYQVIRDINEVLTPITKGNYVGYQKVYVKQVGLGGELNTFISPRDVQLLTPLNVNYPFIPVADADYKRGVLSKKEVFNEDQQLLIKEEYDYWDISEEVESIAIPFETQLSDCPWDQFYNFFDDYVNMQAITSSDDVAYEIDVRNCQSNGDIGIDWFTFVKGTLLPKTEVTTEYSYDGNIVSETSTTTNYQYNGRQRVSSKESVFNEGGLATTYREDYYYPFVYPGGEFTSNESAVFQQITLLNQIETPILKKQYKNGQLIGSVKQIFGQFHPNLYRLTEIKSSKQGTLEESRITYHEYDILGNPLEVSQTNGTRISYIWGYNGMYPVAKLENASYDQFSASNLALIDEVIDASDSDIDAASEATMRSKLSELYNTFPNAMISAFTYDPLIGVTSTSDTRGYRNYFTYDDSYRLKFVKDADQHIVAANEYFNRNGNDNLHNYVKSTIYRTGTTTGLVTLPTDKIETMSYFDGLGRTIQTIAGRAGEQQQDVIIPFEYDQWGRQTKEYLPYVNGGQTPGASSLAYRDNDAIISVLDNYYINKYPADFIAGNINAYSERELEASPLGRVLRQGAPGSAWSLANTGADDHSIKSIYQTNKVVDNVRIFRVENLNDNPLNIALSEDGQYATGELYKSITKDENWTSGTDHTTEVYTDKLGRIVLKRNFDDSQRHDTYYIYDNFGNLTFVLSPEASEEAIITQSILDDLGYQYKYDHRNRLVEKKTPGKGWEYIVYDILDRPALTQDEVMKNSEQWLFTKYDIFSRIAYTGFYNSDQERTAIQNAINQSTVLYEDRKYTTTTGTPIYHTNNAFPNASGTLEILTADYYDDYNISNQITFNPANGSGVWEGMSVSLAIKGLPTISRVKVLETNDWVTAATYYDEKGRAWETHSKNDFLGTQDWVLNKLDFVGNIEKTSSMHFKGSTVITINDYFTYDHANRLLTHKQSINNQEDEVIVSNTYDEQGQLIEKGVGGKVSQSRLQDIDYQYNARGWLTQINDVGNLGADLFSFKINYNQQEGAVQYEDLYNGNISQTIWKTASTDHATGVTGEKRGYSYRYDALNRITLGIMRKGDNLDIYTQHHLRSVGYDKNGNITHLKRDGKSDIVDDLTYFYDNGNQLIKVDDAITVHNEEGFKDGNTVGNDYFYDTNGNMIKDLNKGIDAIAYNHLNLPVRVVTSEGSIDYIYDAVGIKHRKQVTEGNSVNTTDYALNFQYENDRLQFIAMSEGYIEPVTEPNAPTKYEYFYQYRDHLDNNRLTFFYNEATGTVDIA
ncbi:MAG: DUF6443 domain-containing protein [Cyclobacteriaceae bacterium]